MHSGHFGSSTSSVPEPTHPLALRHQLRSGFGFVSIWQQFIALLRLHPTDEDLSVGVDQPIFF
jgi:hypothetical protein